MRPPPRVLLNALGVAALVAAALVLYWSALRYPAVFDDQALGESWLKLQHAESPFTRRWLSNLTFEWVYRAFGGQVFAQRVVNVLLHGATAAMLFGFLARLFGALLEERRARWLAFCGAALFVVHPVAVYAVAYLMQRSIVLATLFSLASLWLILEWLLRGAPRWSAWYVAAAAAYYLAGFSKEHAVMLPAVAVSLAVLVRGPSLDLARRGIVALVLFAAVGASIVLSTRDVIGTVYEPLVREAAGPGIDESATYGLSVLNQAALYFRYLLTWFLPWPGWMSVDLHPALPRSFGDWPFLAGFAAWLALPFAAGWLLLRGGAVGLAGFGLLFAWLLALTEVATVRVQEPLVLYRSYLWMSGLPVLLPLLAGSLAPRWRLAVLFTLCALLVIAARERLATFESELALWSDAIAKNTDLHAPFVERAYVQRGTYYLRLGRTEAALADLDRAIELNPRSAAAHFVRGAVHIRRRALAEALDDANRAVALNPGYAAAYNMRCALLTRQGAPQAALADCTKALEIDPSRADAWINRAIANRALGRVAEAATSYERALALTPANATAHAEYGKLLFDAGRRDELVRAHLVKACEAGIPSACETLKAVP
jgi:protein O-mannosyl-transferase